MHVSDRISRMDKIIAVLHESLSAAGRILKKYADGIASTDIHHKDEINLVTKADLESENKILEIITSAFPHHAVLTEEAGEVVKGVTEGRPSWIIDPLDGTTNFSHAFPIYCVSIAYFEDSIPVIGGVYDPTRDELFFAKRGEGATKNGKPIKVSSISTLRQGLLATGFPYDIKTSKDNNLDFFEAFALEAQAIRRTGSAALDLCYLACGRFDGFWELKLHPWDTAAAWLIVEEAGGRITDFGGGAFDIFKKQCLGSNGTNIHEEMINLLQRISSED
jgi:myo-inositol-1(or 4)-monophosphatase